MKTPVRIQRKRSKGFDLFEANRAAGNGLPVIYVGRPSKFCNPVSIEKAGGEREAVRVFRRLLSMSQSALVAAASDPIFGLVACAWQVRLKKSLRELQGHNVACWCGLCPKHKAGLPAGEKCADCPPCHGDVLLEKVNRKPRGRK